MPIDPRIALQVGQGVEPIKSPLETYSKILGVKNQQQDQELGRQQIDSNRATMEANTRKQQQAEASALKDQQEEDVIHGIINAKNGKLEDALPEIRKVARVNTYLALEKTAGELRKAHSAADKDQLDIEKDQNLRLAEVTGQALAKDDAALAQDWPLIKQAALAVNPNLQIPDQPLSRRELQAFRSQFMIQGASAKEAADAAALRGTTADAGAKESNLAVTEATNAARLKDPNLMSPEEKAKLDEQMLTTDIKEYNATTPPEQRTREGLSKFLVDAANRKTPKTSVTTNVNDRHQFQDETTLRKEFDDNPTVKAYNEIKTQAARAKGAYDLAKQAEKDGKSASSSDQVIITVLNKVLDPESVVRESEYARTADGQSAISRLTGYLDKLKRGGAGISSAERASLMETIESLTGATEREYQPVAQKYRGLADQYGFSPDRIAPAGGKSGGTGKISVKAPDGSLHEFETQAQADAFKKLANIK